MKVIAMSIKKQSPLGKYLLLILVVLIFNFPAVIAAQPSPTIEWQRCLGGSLYEYPNRVITTNDGGYLVIGHTASNDGDVYNAPRIFYTGWVVHLDQFGSTLWTRCLNLDDVNHITDVIQTSDSGYLLVGRTRSRYVDSSRTHGRWDALIVKLNKNGNVRWQRSYGGSKDDYASSIVESSLEGGGYIFVGATSSVDGDVLGHHNSPDTSRSGYYDSTDAWVVAISYNGDLQWQKCLGGDSADFAHTIIKTPTAITPFLAGRIRLMEMLLIDILLMDTMEINGL